MSAGILPGEPEATHWNPMKPLFPKPVAAAILLFGIVGWIAAMLIARFMEPEGSFSDFLGYFLGFAATPALILGLLGYFVGQKKAGA